MSVIDIIRGVHIAAGSLALTAMWVPLFSPKGGNVHRRAGRVYVIAMAFVALAAIAASTYRLLYDTDPERRMFATYLLFVAMLAAAQCSAGVRVLRYKSRRISHRHPWDLGIALLLTGSGIAVFAWGIVGGEPLFIGFAPVGIVIGAMQLVYWLRPPSRPMHWWFEHMFSMFGAGIGTVTAFTVVNAGHMGLPRDSLVVWLGPSVVGLSVYAIWSRHYRRRFRKPGAAASQAA